MEAVVLQTFGNVDGLDSRRLREGPGVKNKLVSAATMLIGIQNLVMRSEPTENVVGVEQGNLGRLLEAIGT